jgi:TatD DNase family protein
MRFLLATKSSTALALISSSKPYIPHRTRIRTPTRAAMSSEQAGTNNYVDAGANLLDSMYQGMYHGKPRHEPDLDLVLQRSYDSGIRQIISLAGTTKESVELQEFISKLDNADCKEKVKVFGTVGIHPTRCAEEFAEKISENADGSCEWIPKTEQQQKEIIQKLISIANTGKISGNVVAIGEFGLDYERLQFTPKDIQQIGLRAQLEVATETKLPLYLHNRASGEDLYSILSEYKERLQFDKDYHGIRGIVHSFDESLDIATQFISLGLYIGINGCSLKTPENLEMVKGIPLESIILETDCPWCDIRPTHASYSHIKTTFPSKKEKQYNRDTSKEFCVKNRTEPCHVLQVAEVIAGVKMLEVSKVLETCCRNVFQLFGDLARS